MFYKIGVHYGNPEVTTGGVSLKFYSSLRLEIRPTGKIKSVSVISALVLIIYEWFNLYNFICANAYLPSEMLF